MCVCLFVFSIAECGFFTSANYAIIRVQSYRLQSRRLPCHIGMICRRCCIVTLTVIQFKKELRVTGRHFNSFTVVQRSKVSFVVHSSTSANLSRRCGLDLESFKT